MKALAFSTAAKHAGFLRTLGIVAVAHLVCFWISYAILVAQWSHISPWQFFGLVPSPPPSHFEVFAQWAFIILGAPFSILIDGISLDHFIPALILCSVLNSALWSFCLVAMIYGVSNRFRREYCRVPRN